VVYPSHPYSKVIRKTQHRCHKATCILDANIMQNTGLHNSQMMWISAKQRDPQTSSQPTAQQTFALSPSSIFHFAELTMKKKYKKPQPRASNQHTTHFQYQL
jgi:hypothetical protein